MTKTQKLTLRSSEIRSRLNELAGIEERSDEENNELESLTAEYRTVEQNLRAAIVAEDEPAQVSESGEKKELREMHEGANLGVYVDAVLEQRQVDGAEKELQDHYNLAGNQLPVELLRETRAATEAPADTQANQQEILMPVFASTATSWLDIPMPRVPVGDSLFPVLTNRPTVGGPHTGSENVGESTGAFEVKTLAPTRLQASFFWRRTDAARFSGMENALRMALSEALGEELDKNVIAGAGHGLLDGTVLSNNNAGAAVTTYQELSNNLLYKRVEGRFANRLSDLKILMGSDSYAYAGNLFIGSLSEWWHDFALRLSSGVRVSAHVPAPTSSGKLQNILVRVGTRQDYVAPIWEGVTLIPDSVTKAATGEIQLTAVMMANFSLIRAAGFHKQQIRIAA